MTDTRSMLFKWIVASKSFKESLRTDGNAKGERLGAV
jgi:hypothetical protein